MLLRQLSPPKKKPKQCGIVGNAPRRALEHIQKSTATHHTSHHGGLLLARHARVRFEASRVIVSRRRRGRIEANLPTPRPNHKPQKGVHSRFTIESTTRALSPARRSLAHLAYNSPSLPSPVQNTPTQRNLHHSNFVHRPRIRLRPLQEATISTEHFGQRVSRQLNAESRESHEIHQNDEGEGATAKGDTSCYHHHTDGSSGYRVRTCT